MQLAPTNSGDLQTAAVGTTLPNPLRVLVRRGADPAPGVAVYWQTSQGRMSLDQSLTDASGIASVQWTLDTLAGGMAADAILPPQAGSSDTVGTRLGFTALANPGPPTQLRFSVPPSNAFTGRALRPAVQLSALDRFGNLVTDFAGSVTIALGANPGGGSLSGATTAAVVGGVASFADLRIDQAGIAYTLRASAGGLAVTTSAAFDIVTPGPGRIVFQSDRDGNSELYSMNADGSGVVRLTIDQAFEGEAAWSPDGKTIAFDFGISIYAMNADGSAVSKLADSVHYPAWSHDGTRIVGSRGTRVCGRGCRLVYGHIFVMNADGSGLVVLTSGNTPAWSLDGRIAYADNGDIKVMNPDGSGLIGVTNDSATFDVFPAWSPDGTKIAFVRASAGAYDLYVMNADGTGVTQLTHDQATEGRPAWSSDGTRIAFASNKDGDSEIYVINADGSGVIQLSDNAAFDGWPAWAP